jgi:hypothetical protein
MHVPDKTKHSDQELALLAIRSGRDSFFRQIHPISRQSMAELT